jgi:hypothetical protein
MWILVLMFLLTAPAWAEDLGELSANPFNPDSTSNPFGAGSPFKPDGLNNPFSPYGSPFSNQSATNPFATDAPRLLVRLFGFSSLSGSCYEGRSWTSGRPDPNSSRNCSLCGGQRGDVIDLTLNAPCSLPQVYRALGVQPELGAVAK